MKIDIDLSEIFEEGEEGPVKESIKDEIINAVVNLIYGKLDRTFTDKFNELLNRQIDERLKEALDTIIPQLMDYEFTETARYGASEKKTTVKNRILKALESECEYREARSGYSGDNNAFTKAIRNIIAAQMKEYKPKFDQEVNALFVKEALEYAVGKVKEKLGIKV